MIGFILLIIIMRLHTLPGSSPVLSINTQSDVYVVKYNSDGNYMMSGHADRSVKV